MFFWLSRIALVFFLLLLSQNLWATSGTLVLSDEYTFSSGSWSDKIQATGYSIESIDTYLDCLDGVIIKKSLNSDEPKLIQANRFESLIGNTCSLESFYQLVIVKSYTYQSNEYGALDGVQSVSLHSSFPFSQSYPSYLQYRAENQNETLLISTTPLVAVAWGEKSSALVMMDILPPRVTQGVASFEHTSVLAPPLWASRYELIGRIKIPESDNELQQSVISVLYPSQKSTLVTVLCGEERRICKDQFDYHYSLGATPEMSTVSLFPKKYSTLNMGEKITVVLQWRRSN